MTYQKVSKIRLGVRNPNRKIDPETEITLMASSPADWTPIVIIHGVLIDGMQRVLVARKHGIQSIPGIEL